MNVSAWCNKIIKVSFYLLFILVPLILTPWNYELFEYNKMIATYGLTVVIMGAWAINMVREGRLRVAKTPLDIPIALFVASQLVSAVFSIDRHVSWFGYYSRFNGGMWSVICYVALYYAFLSNIEIFGSPVDRLKRLIKLILATAGIVAAYGVAEHYGIDKNLWVQDVQSRVFSTLGQPNWLAAYLVPLIPAAMVMGWKTKGSLKTADFWVWGLLSVLFFITLLFTRSRSGLLGLAAADAVFWLILFLRFRKHGSAQKKQLLLPFIFLHAIFVPIVFINGIYVDQVDRWFTFTGWKNRLTRIAAPKPAAEKTPSGTMLESGGTESGTIRKYVWQAAVNAWRANPKNMAIGTGTETFAFSFYQYRPKEHNLTSEWDFLYNKAHNEYLNYLATTGIFGLGTYLALIAVFVGWYLRNQKAAYNGKNPEPWMTNTALFAGWTSILVTNFFGFSVVIIQLLFFLLPAIIIARVTNLQRYSVSFSMSGNVLRVTSWTLACIAIILTVAILRSWQADTYFSTGYRLARANQFAAAQTAVTKAIAISPNEPLYHDELATTLGSLVLSAVEQKNATLAATLAKQSLSENDRAIAISPNNVNFWKTRTKLFYTFSSFDPALNASAVQALETARSLSPTDPKIIYNLAILYGRQGDSKRAVELLTEAKDLKPNYRDAYFGLYVFHTEMKNNEAARAELQYYLDHVDPGDADFQSRLSL